MSLIIFFAALALLIISHELGHFSVAKFFGIKVEEFGLGFPPRATAWRRGETLYSLNWLPFGGFVKIFGEDGEVDERSLAKKPKGIQALVLVAGVIFNVILAWLLFSLALATVGLPTTADNAPAGVALSHLATTITAVQPASPASQAGLKVGDQIISLRVGVSEESASQPTPDQVINFFQKSKSESVVIQYQRGSTLGQAEVKPLAGLLREAPERRAIGVGLDGVGLLRLPLAPALYLGGQLTYRYTLGTVAGLYDLVSQALRGEGSLAAVSGPVGLVGLIGQSSALGLSHLLALVALISINLAILNLIPFPALDGGRLLLLFLEWLRGQPLSAKVSTSINYAGFSLLIILMLIVTYSDLLKLFRG